MHKKDGAQCDFPCRIEWYDEALNWNDPERDLLWNEDQIHEFLTTAKRLYLALRDQLSAEYEIEFRDHM